MICPTCGPTMAYLAKDMRVCWCEKEFCVAHMAEHVATCGPYKNPTAAPRPAKVEKAARQTFKMAGFEPIGKMIPRRFKTRR